MTSKGYLVFAYNNSHIDYGSLALTNSCLLKKKCKINDVALVTSEWTVDHLIRTYGQRLFDYAFQHVTISNIGEHTVSNRRYQDTRYTRFNAKYYNTNRSDSYDVTPFEQTMLLDADYFILDNTMDLVWDNQEDFLCNKRIVNLDHSYNDTGFDTRFNDMSIPLYWATAVYFKKTPKSKTIFDQIRFIKENYEFYQYLYNFEPNGFFRNDYALSISIHQVNKLMEYDSVKPLPVDHILLSTEFDELHYFKDGALFITSELHHGQFKLHKIERNVHIMNKLAARRLSDQIIAYATS